MEYKQATNIGTKKNSLWQKGPGQTRKATVDRMYELNKAFTFVVYYDLIANNSHRFGNKEGM
jgi:hypothetical protein